MPKIEVFEKDEDTPIFEGEFTFMPRIGEYISKDIGGYFGYYHVVEIWHREEGDSGIYQACIQVELRD
ncbi:hypothetical protein [Novosphingobium clariflavum]|uniref:Uncharacterized protein n=1 Tax=Novosphingobium clariflavum TaxID=2029884 RepID=A0ABV6S766_9SPHN|nr:hypothetical protein [Novosphingobium clariflavum]